jgi:hypothetical protein
MPIKRTKAAAKKSAAKKRVLSVTRGVPKRVRAKQNGIKLSNVGAFSFSHTKIKREDECYGPLDDASQKAAEAAGEAGTLFMLDDKLKCSCGKTVSAKKSSMGDYYEPVPRPHARYKQPRKTARKPGGGNKR